jgi:uridine kinase
VIILIDGRSGSGKTELAKLLAETYPEFELVRLDDLYPGWDGLEAGSAAVPEIIRERRWRAWDWSRDAPGEWHALAADRPLIIEGVGAISRASRPLADIAIWVELDDDTRKIRALERDGDAYAPHWERWAAQERAYLAREDPRSLASVIVEA